MRGTLIKNSGLKLEYRITPAHAGNTDCRCNALAVSWDHPRACGEHLPFPRSTSWMLGSPPRMRGTPEHIASKAFAFGITPAHAGNTSHLCNNRVAVRDHPRACGEHALRNGDDDGFSGSPPRMRGTPQKPGSHSVFGGITPAHAGNTLWSF